MAKPRFMNQFRILLLAVVASTAGCVATTPQEFIPIDTNSLSSDEEAELNPHIQKMETFLRSTDETGDYRQFGRIVGFVATELLLDGDSVAIFGCAQFSRGSPKSRFAIMSGRMEDESVSFTYFGIPYAPNGPPEECK